MSPMQSCLYVIAVKRGAPIESHATPNIFSPICAVWRLGLNVHSFVYSFVDVNNISSEILNQSNYLWWWINRFVFRWRAQLAALSTTNCRRIEWWNLERERVLGQSQCYSWFRGFFLTQLHASEVRDAVAIRDRLFLSEWWVGSLPSYQRISIPSVTY